MPASNPLGRTPTRCEHRTLIELRVSLVTICAFTYGLRRRRRFDGSGFGLVLSNVVLFTHIA